MTPKRKGFLPKKKKNEMTDRSEENEIVECKKLKIAKVREKMSERALTTKTWLTTDSSLFLLQIVSFLISPKFGVRVLSTRGLLRLVCVSTSE